MALSPADFPQQSGLPDQNTDQVAKRADDHEEVEALGGLGPKDSGEEQAGRGLGRSCELGLRDYRNQTRTICSVLRINSPAAKYATLHKV